MNKTYVRTASGTAVAWIAATVMALAAADGQAPGRQAGATGSADAQATNGVVPPADYVIGPNDVLMIRFWRDQDMSTDVVVRPDGKISLQLINDIQASGLTPEELGANVQKASAKFLQDPVVTVIVKEIHSRMVFIVGQVGKAGPHPLMAPTTVLQMIAMAGGLGEFADTENVLIIRNENGRQTSFRFNYKDVARGRNLQQNILLKPGDTIVVR